jgi:integrase
MSLYRRDEGGVWYVRWQDEHGRTRRTSARTRDHHQAALYAARLAIRVDKLKKGENPDRPKYGDRTLSQFLNEEYVEMVANKTLREDVARFDRHIQPHMGEYQLCGITVKDCQRLQTKVCQSVSSSTTNRVMSLLSAMLTKAIQWEMRSGPNPCHAVKPLREGPSPRKVLTPMDEVKLQAHVTPPVHAFIMLALNTGCRRGELLSLRWEDVEIEDGGAGGMAWINLKETKTGSPRKIPLNIAAIRALSSLPDPKEPTNLIFFGWGGSINYAISMACHAAGIPHYRIHDFRHTFCTRLSRKGVDVATIMRLAGHKKLATTLLYLEPRSGREAVDLL